MKSLPLRAKAVEFGLRSQAERAIAVEFELVRLDRTLRQLGARETNIDSTNPDLVFTSF